VDTEALFISQSRQRLTVEGVRRLMEKYANGINGKHITPHKMRSSAATNLAKAGVDIQTIADILGHSSVTTTQRYAAVLEQNKQQATDALDDLF
jgi:integrase/recombinase XerD